MKNNLLKTFRLLLQSLVLSILLSSTTFAQAHSFVGAAPNDFRQHEFMVGFFDEDFFDPDIYHPPSPIFWHSHVKASSGIIFVYEHNFFHAWNFLSVNVGASTARWRIQGLSQYTLSGYLALRLWLFHIHNFSSYVTYSAAGPSFISRTRIHGAKLGEHFIWEDFLGWGFQFGNHPAFDFSAKLYHYSNGDFFNHNNGFDIPVVLSLGISF